MDKEWVPCAVRKAPVFFYDKCVLYGDCSFGKLSSFF